ncbi:OsmC family protein [Alkalibacillus almallahensis]|uniref:OsmC family protein n=1 Tax=Alkalibacillus almallahensis TaxID=1379154 RepID=UPI00141E76E9|nr:OsmC family protein [Alkalibacillus almallahensis]NIK11497.1 peroxiredoxin-like protein [Alkalibacillus almallahensis]
MKELSFETTLSWSGADENGEGTLNIGEESVVVSGPENMGGKGVGASPEELLVSAIATCYSETLSSLLTNEGLTFQTLAIQAEGIVSELPKDSSFKRITIHPTIIGADEERYNTYKEIASDARDKCFVGQAIKGNMEYLVGNVHLVNQLLDQNQIDELVETFYQRLIDIPAFQSLFQERDVDVEKLKERQKTFLAQVADEGEDQEALLEQVQQRHTFDTNSERSQMWLDTMRETLHDMELSPELSDRFMNKVNDLFNRM